MTQVLVLYYSKRGNTKKMARLIARGVESVDGCQAVLRTVESSVEDYQATDPIISESDMQQCDALVLGSPAYFGNMAADLKSFIDTTGNLWFSGAMEGKPAGVFTSGSSLHGGQETTLLSMMIPLLHYGMLVMGLPYSEKSLLYTKSGGSPYGPSHWTEFESKRPIDADEKQLCLALGKRIASCAHRLKPTEG
ncbi:NAD(P)H:quinone oxidoreductase [Marinicella sp. W31]|uniref:NAD(P)H:quinone oxidoreductase n=1 Tax=Marinicella sp. W31 TaxID=3023713 RepID=UPI0037567585